MNSYKIDDIKEDIELAINSSLSMREAGSKLNMNFKTFVKYAKLLGLYKPNMSGKGIKKKTRITPLSDILAGKNPEYHTYKLGKRLISERIKNHQCEVCKLSVWNNSPIPLELDHIDGNPYNHIYSNIRLLCPNCHAQTSNYRAKNKKK